MLQIQNLKKGFGTDIILEGLDWNLQKGKVYGLIGSNGSGKSTLLRCIAGVYQSDAGSITVDGEPVYNNPDVKKDIVFLSDEPFYLDQSSLKQMKSFYRLFYESFDEERYGKLVDLFHFNENKTIHRLSKGLKRQASLILNLSLRPKLLLMDESFDGLDPMIRLALKRYLAESVLDDDLAVVISSHNIRELEDICDVMTLLDKKRLIFSSELSQLQNNYHKVQIAFDKDVHLAEIKQLKPMYVEQSGRIFTVVVRGDIDPFIEKINQLEPVLINPINLTMEELFVREMEANQGE
ncbi:MAG: ABC transporter ATP-binding protein [Erysipelothrix sp.]|nr:ABC transporter ATP-binding protein [Erysipelothrix sp.]